VHRELRAGYTLIELVVVISIILILAAMLLPVLERGIKSAEATSCLANIRQLALASQLYASDYDEGLPPALLDLADSTKQNCWDILLLPYVGSSQIYICCADENPTTGPAYTNSLTHSYGINLDLTMVGGYNGASLTQADIAYPTRTILFFEIGGSDRRFGTWYSYPGLSVVDRRHRGGSNYGFVDGHGTWRRAESTVAPENCWLP